MRSLMRLYLFSGKCFPTSNSPSVATCWYSKLTCANLRPVVEPSNMETTAARNVQPNSNTKVVTAPSNSPLVDTFGRQHTYLRISLTERCNLRCKYCMPAEGVLLQPKSHLLTTDEIYFLARIFVEQGVRKIRLTGGEPTVRRDIVDIITQIKAIPQLENVGITTNGLVLTRLLVPMQRAGLDAVNISLDTLRPKRFEEITRRKGWERVIAGIDLAIQLGYTPKVNCVLMRNFNDDEICDFVEFTKERRVDVRFIEYMPFSGNKWQTDKLISFKDTLEIIRRQWPEFKALPNGPNDTSKAYTVPGFLGRVGFITSMTEHFCGSCNRLRLTADGNIKVCLFGNKEYSLRDAMRKLVSEDDLVALISAAVKKKKKQHADNIEEQQTRNHRNYRHAAKISNTLLLYAPTHFSHPHKYNLSHFSAQAALSNKITHMRIQQYVRAYCTQIPNKLTHVDERGRAVMVDVSKKESTTREATACATVAIGSQIAQLIRENNVAKGDVLTVAQIAGIGGAKKTAELIPLCHNITLTSVHLEAQLNMEEHTVELRSTVRCCGKTGVEMEALAAVTVAALAVYDMCKAISHDIIIRDVRLWSKSGGKRDFKRNLT